MHERMKGATNDWSHKQLRQREGLCEVQAALRRFRGQRMVTYGLAATFQYCLTAGIKKQRKEEEPVKPIESPQE